MSRYIPPGLGLPVSYRQFSWLMIATRAWGAEFYQPDHGIYEFSNGRRFDSTDLYTTGVYRQPLPVVVPPVLSAVIVGNNVELTWEGASASETTILSYVLWRAKEPSDDFDQLAVLQGTSAAYTDLALSSGTYTYFLLALAATGWVSPDSNQVTATV